MRKGFNNNKKLIEQDNLKAKSPKQKKFAFSMSNLKTAIMQNKAKVITSIIAMLTIISIVMLAIYHANETQKRRDLIAINPELARAMTYGELTEKDEETQSENVRFSVYFARDLNGDGYADRVKGTCKEVEGEDTLYMSLNVIEDGYLKDAKIEIEADNIYFKTALVDDEVVQGNYISENTTTINLKQVQAGTQKLIFGQVRSGDYRYTSTKKDALGKDTNKLSGVNKIKLTGTHVSNDGKRTEIEKVIELPVDWYGTTKAEIATTGVNGEKNKYQNYNSEGIIDEEKQEVNLEFKIVAQESKNELLLKKGMIEGTIPELNGYKPTKVEILGENLQFTYDEETGNFTAYREAEIGEDGVVSKEAYSSTNGTIRYHEIKLKVTYPLEAYEQSNGTVILNIPVKATFEGYNNENEEFNNPYISNTAEDIITVTYERGGGDVIGYDVQVGTWVPNPYNVYVVSKANAVKYYNQVQDDTKDTYEVRWYVSRGNSGEIANVQLREQDSNYTDKFQTIDGTYEDMLQYSKNIGIYFTTPGAMFGENGWIRVYNDETDELIHEFTSEDWENYTKENPYVYDEPVNHIRIETSKAERVSSFTATSIKEMNNVLLTTEKTREEFDKLSKIYSYLSGYAKYSEEEEYQKLKDDTGTANYDEALSMAQITNVTPTTLSTQETTNMKITIGTVNLGYNVEAWKNGTFLLKFPEEVLLAEINSVTINNVNVNVLGYDIYEQDGSYFLKILTENENPEHYVITIDANITPDPRKISATRDIELYAYNEECNNYKDTLRAQDIYDINGDGNIEDFVDYSKRSVTFVGPSTLLTTETASDYNEEGDELKTTVAPQVAEIDKTQNNRTAKISVQITNNYSGNISGIVVIGKTPFAGNTSQVLGNDLGSTFTANMTGPIELPENLQGIATIYYSENETVNSDLNDASNNWKTADDITDFSKIRTYAIDLRDYTIEKNEEYICTYEIEVPQDVNYNDVSYSTHAVYFYLETDEGKLADQTETNKLGFKIARKYNLEINKVKQGTNSPIQGASFSVQEEGEESSRIISSDVQGKINIQDLYVGKVYTVKEIKAPSDYVLNGEIIKFTTTVDDNGDLQVQKLEGNSNLNVEQATEEEPAKVSFIVTNEPKYTLKLTKEDQNGNLVQGVRFNLTGEGLPTAGRTVTTNSNGELTITGLYPNEEYTLTEVYAEGYAYSEAPIKFKTVWNGNNLEAQVIEGSFKTQPTVDNSQEKQPIMSASIVNNKLAEYNLTLEKYEKETPNPLEGAIFKVTGKWLDNEYATDESGMLNVGPLYEGIEYTIEEVMPPEGYALSENTVRFVVNTNEEGKQQLQILEGEIKPSADFETEEKISTEDSENSEVTEDSGDSETTVEEGQVIDKDGNPIEDKEVIAKLDGDKISEVMLSIDNKPLFSLIKMDGETQEPLPNVKFSITKVEDDGTETEALDSKGELIGETTEIDGKTYQVITTDEQGRITEDLPEGYYKVVEIETLEGYQLPENEEDRTYFFGIGKTKPAVKEMVELWSQTFEGNGEITYTDSVATDDGGYIKIGYFQNTIKFDADETESEEEIILTAQGTYEDAFILKYNMNNKIVWARTYKVSQTEKIYSIVRCIDGKYLISGDRGNAGTYFTFHLKYDNEGNLIEEYENLKYSVSANGENEILQTSDGGFVSIENFNNPVTIPAESTVDNQEIVINTNGNTDGLVIKYNLEHKVEWARSIGGKQADTINDIAIDKNGNIVIVGQFTYNSTENYIKIPAEETVNKEEIILSNAGSTDSFIVKYSSEGLVEWAENPGATGNYEGFKSICIIQENKYLVFGYLGSTGLNISSDKTANGQSINIKGHSAIIQYNGEGKIEWAEGYMTGSNGYSAKIANTSDDGYIQVGLVNTNATSITADQTANNQEIKLSSNGQRDFLVLKSNKDNKVEWAGQFGSSLLDETDTNVKAVIELPNNRYLVQVYLSAKAIIPSDQTTLGREIELLGNVTLIYNRDGLVEYASSKVSSSSEYNSVVATSDGGQIAVGQFKGRLHIDAEQTSNNEDINLLSNYDADMLITKYNQEGKIDWTLDIGGRSELDELWQVIQKDDTYIAVGVTHHNIHIDKKYTATGEDIEITANGTRRGVIIQFNEEGKVIWANIVINECLSIDNTEDGGYIITGLISSNKTIPAEETVDGQAISLSTKGSSDAIVLKYNSENKIEWYSQIGGTDVDNLKSISYANGEYTAVGIVRSQFQIPANATETGETINIDSESGGLIVIKYNGNGKIAWAKEIETTNKQVTQIYLTSKGIITTEDGGSIITGKNFGKLVISQEQTINNQEINIIANGVHRGYIIKFNQEGLVEWGYSINGNSNLYMGNICKTTDGGFVLTGQTVDGLSIDADQTVNGEKINLRGGKGYIIKYNKDEKIEYAKIISDTNTLNDITENNGSYTVVGYNQVNGINVGYIGSFQENTISAEIPEQQELTVENYKEEYKITTEVDGDGGTISGQGSTSDNPYEIVEDGENSTKDIVITPEPGYKILEITVNGEKIEFTPEEDGSVILDKFINMTSDKHVVVKFSNSVSTVVVHHYKDETTDKLLEDETLTGEIGTNYTTAPKDIADYEVVIEKLPSNASGQYTEDVQEVIYYYKQIPVKFIVHHYLEGTEEIVQGSEDDQINEERERGSEYTTSPATGIDDKYELVEISGNPSGTLTENETVVTYYYRVKDSAGVIVHHIDTDSKEQIAPDVMIPLDGTGKYGDSYTTEISQEIPANYEYVTRTDNWEGTMIDKVIEVTYEYRLVVPSITEQNISKTATESIDNPKAETEYGINYTAKIENYIGKTQVTIVDTLPYKIDVAKSSLNGGTYDEESQTITWVELVDGVDTYANPESGNIEINKTIKVVYLNMDVSKETIENNVSGKVKLFTPDKTSEEVTGKATTNTEFKMNITVNKVWKDNDTQSARRPEVITINVIGEEDRVVQSYDLKVKEESSYTFTDLPKYNREGNEIQYRIEEQEKTLGDLHFYTSSVNETTDVENEKDHKQTTITNTFTTPTDTINIIANKIWKDNDIQAQRRPDSIILVVKNGDQEVKTQEITKEDIVEETTNQWSTIIEGLQKYDENGNEIQYTVEEKEKNADDLKFYEAEENFVTVEDHQATIRNAFVKPDDTTTVTVNKVWNDNNDANGKRPESIKVKVTGNGQTYTQEINAPKNEIEGNSNGWTYTFTDLPKYDDNGQEIIYTVSEEVVNPDDLKFYINDGVTGDMTSGYTITNTFTVPDERIELTVNKEWVDNNIQAQRRPEIIVINVKAENADNNNPEEIIDTYELNTETETSHTFIGLKKYNSQGNEIKYTVEEQEKNPGDLHFYTISSGMVKTTGENTKEVTITNTFEKPDDRTEVTVTKVWNDNHDEAEKRPESIMLQLKSGNETVKEQIVNVDNKVEDQRKEEIIAEINANIGEEEISIDTVEVWQHTFTDVETYNENGEEIQYTVDETEVNSNDLQFYKKSVEGTTIINTFTQDTTKVDVPVTKIWEDNEIQAQRRPESVIVILKANGQDNQVYELSEKTADTVTESTWTYTFKELPKYDEYNNIINYTVEEEETLTGDLKFYTSKVDGTTITNTFTKPTDTIRIEVNKEWVDQDNAYEKRPASIKLEVKNGDAIVNSTVVTKDDGWSATFVNLPKYDNDGQEIAYTVDEEEVMENDLFNYEKEIGEVTDKIGTIDEKEAIITNTMTKVPSTVEVKYLDINTGEEIADRKTKEGIIGDSFDVTEDRKDIEGYTLVEEPGEKTGIYTLEPQEKIYYYAKNTRVIVKYLEQDDTPEDIADNKVLAKEVTIEGYEGQDYTTVEEEISGYTLVATTDNLKGTMQRDEIVVIYYYAENTTVTVKYLEQDNTPNDNSDNKVLAPEEVINGYVGKDYTTQAQDISGYTLVKDTENTEGTMAKDPIEVIYYYAQNTKVIVKYLEKDETPDDNTDNQVLADEIVISGYEGLEYETEQKDIENYTFVESTNNTEGSMTKNVIEVIYYYAQNTKATVQYIDRETGEILKEETQEGKVGDLFETQAEDFEGYVLVESPEEPNIIMDKTGEQVVKYYYAHVSAGVIEKHIDDITGELLYSEEHQGNEGDSYNIASKTFEGYDLVTEDENGNSKLPENAKGEMKRDEVIEVKYYYIKKAKVIVKYLEEDDTPEDTTDNQVLAEEEIIEGHENDNYETMAKEIEDYNLVKTPENATGIMVITKNPDGSYNTEIEVIYYYKKVAGGVIENHIDITTGNTLATEEHKGNVGDAYDIPSRTFEGYDLVEVDSEGNNMLPTNAIGTMTEEKIVVNYYYIKQAKVTVEYIDKQTGEKLDEEEIKGYIGDSYETEQKEFEGYDIVEKPSNSTGKMTEEETVVKYYYARKAEVEVKYLEKGTEYEIAENEIIEGLVGDNYETSEKEIPYYKFVEKTSNWEGNMTEDKITVIYYYEKQIFDLKIDKWVSSVNVNGIHHEARNINNKDEMYVVDIHRSKTETADIRITYKIRVTNTGEIEGTAGQIMEVIPKGYSYYQEDNNIYWEERNGTFVTDTLKDETIEAGEYKEIEIVLRWNKGEENFGEKENLVILTQENNPAGYQDVNEEDNHSTSNMMITVATGLDTNGRIILTASITMVLSIILAVNVSLLIVYKKGSIGTRNK